MTPPLDTETLEIEVSVQDCFFTTVRDSEFGDRPISEETWRIWLCQWLKAMQSDLPEAIAYELSLRLSDDTEVQELNAQYRHKNQPTDVLSFAALEVDYPQFPEEVRLSMPLYLGDIIISVETALRQAQQQGHTLQTELAWLAAHGLLHLLGWDHPDDESLEVMLNQQKTLLQTVGITAPKQ